MSESGATRLGGDGTGDDELEDPGRDPKGLTPPRNFLGGGTTDPGQGAPRGEGNVGPGDKPEPPTQEPEHRADEPDHT